MARDNVTRAPSAALPAQHSPYSSAGNPSQDHLCWPPQAPCACDTHAHGDTTAIHTKAEIFSEGCSGTRIHSNSLGEEEGAFSYCLSSVTNSEFIVQKLKLVLRRWHVLLDSNLKGTNLTMDKLHFFEIAELEHGW